MSINSEGLEPGTIVDYPSYFRYYAAEIGKLLHDEYIRHMLIETVAQNVDSFSEALDTGENHGTE